MNRIKAFVLSALLVFNAVSTFSQDVPIDLFTGTPAISVPIWNVQDHDLSVPVMLGYNASGLKLEASPMFIGLGWSVLGSGSVSREVRGLPDDFDGISEAKIENNGTITNYDDRRGWLYPRKNQTTVLAKEVGDYTFGADNSSATCSDEYSDYDQLDLWFGVNDTESDLYHANAPGLSCSFVFDNSTTPQIRLLSLQDLKVEYVINPDSKDITSFTITTNTGIVYEFASTTLEEKHVKFATGVTSAEYLKNEFSQYNYNATSYPGPVKFHREWMLTRMTSPSGAFITFQYTSKDFKFTTPFNVAIRNLLGTGEEVKTIFKVTTKTYFQVLNSITSSAGEKVEFNFPIGGDADDMIRSIRISDSRRKGEFIKEFVLTHSDLLHSPRPFLQSIQERSYCDELPPYQFSYVGVDANGASSLPDTASLAKDFWGYFNNESNTVEYPTMYVYPALPYPDKVRLHPIPGYSGELITLSGADRAPDADAMKIGTLNIIQYPSGGTLTITYEPHQWLDPYTNLLFFGGGLRVKKLQLSDGMGGGVANEIIKEFTYEQSAGVSSGALLNKPVFYIPASRWVSASGAYSASYETLSGGSSTTLWNRLIVRTEENIGTDDFINGSLVAYSKVKIKKTGAGSVEYTYNLPATFGSSGASPWSPTETKFAREDAGSCINMGIMNTGGAWRFPYPQNPNFELERGVPQNVTEYNEAGTKVRETAYSYQTLYKSGSTPFKVWGVKLEDFAESGKDAIFFGKYFLLTEAAKVLSSQTVTEYNAGVAALTTTTQDYYESAPTHNFVTKSVATNSDGTVYTTKIKYAQDYATPSGGADVQSQMIGYMKTNGLTGVPIEMIEKIQRPSESEKVTSASLTMFAPSSTGWPRVDQTLSFIPDSPLATGSFTESSITSGTTFTKHGAYEVTGKINAYDATFNIPVTVEDVKGRSKASTVYGYDKSLPVAQFSEATLAEVAFADFETTTDVDLTKSASIFGKGRSGDNAIHPSVTLSRSISKAATNNYVLGFWINTGTGSVTINASVRYSSTTTTTAIPVASTNNKFKYIEKKIDVSAAPSTFTIEITSDIASGSYTSSPTLLPVIDDVAFYPDYSTMSSTAYDFPYGVATSQANGNASYATYDHLGRLRYVYDKDMNLVKKNSYAYKLLPDKLTAEFITPAAQNGSLEHLYNQPATFTAWEDCHDGVTYEWDFGSGTFTTGSRVQTHTFTSYGLYQVKLRVSKTGLTTTTVTKPLYIFPSFMICAKGTEHFDADSGMETSTFTGTCTTTNSTTKFKTVFKIVGGDISAITSSTWFIRDIGSDTWVDPESYPLAPTVVSGELIVQRQVSQTIPGFEVMCEAVTSTGGVYRSNIIQVIAE
jgi:hypothetical protein